MCIFFKTDLLDIHADLLDIHLDFVAYGMYNL